MVIVDILSLSQTQGEGRHSIFNINYELSCTFFIYALYQVKDAPFYSQLPVSTSYEYGLNFIKCFFLYLLQWHFFSLLMRWIKLFFYCFFFLMFSWPCIPWINLTQSWFITLFTFTGFNLLILCLTIHIYFHKRYKPLILPPFNVIFRFWCWDYIGLMKQEQLFLSGIS